MNVSTKVLVVGISILLVSCNTSPITAPTPILTPNSLIHNPPYVHYSSFEELDIHLEFDYPDHWIFRENKSEYTDLIIISLFDPRFLTVPTRTPEESHGHPSDFPRISVWIRIINRDETLDSFVEPYRQGHDNPPRVSILSDYQIIVDGYAALVLEYENHDFELYTSPMFGRTVFFLAEDKIYSIDFEIAQYERGSEFERGYEYFLNSIKITP